MKNVIQKIWNLTNFGGVRYSIDQVPTTPTPTISATITPTPTSSATKSPTLTPSKTVSVSVSATITPTITVTPTITPTITVTPSITPSQGSASDPTSQPLVQSSNITYLGYFNLPQEGTNPYPVVVDGTSQYDESSWNYGCSCLAMGPTTGTMYVANEMNGGTAPSGSIGIINIPSDLTGGPTATVNTYLNASVNDGLSAYIGANSSQSFAPAPYSTHADLHSAVLYNNRLLIGYYWYYPGNRPSQSLNFIIMNPELTTLTIDQQLGQSLGDTGIDGSAYSGAMGPVGTEWQSLVGGPMLCGQGLVSNDAPMSFGPNAWVFDPDDVGVENPASATLLLYYPEQTSIINPTGGSFPITNWGVANDYWSPADQIATMFIPSGYSSLIFVGLHGQGAYCYGYATSDESLAGTLSSDGVDYYCYDVSTSAPGTGGKGVHAYPYQYWVWAYKMSDVLNVLSGLVSPWEIMPYATWELTIPTIESGYAFVNNGGGCFDPTTGNIYINAVSGETPQIHVFNLASV